MPTLKDSTQQTGVRWLSLQGDKAPVLELEIHDRLVIDGSRVRSRLEKDRRIFVSTVGAQVVGLAAGSRQITSYGRPRLVSATGNRQGTALWALVEDGSLWKFAIHPAAHAPGTDGETAGGRLDASWSRLEFSALGATHIALAPGGQQLLVINAGVGELIDAQTGRSLHTLGPLSAANWDPAAPARLAICRPSGELEVFDNGQTLRLNDRPLLAPGASVVGVSFFNEIWKDPAQPKRQFLLVHSESPESAGLQFIALDPAPLGATLPAAEVQEIAVGCRVAVSPTENILITGAPGGTVAVWFAAPTHDSRPHQLFDLEGHRGEQLTCITFSADGRTVITADTKNRLYAWLSNDPLVKR